LTKELLSIEDVERLRLVLGNPNEKNFSVSVKPLIINDEIYYLKEEVLNLLLANKSVSTRLQCFNEKEVKAILGYEDDSFLPSYKFHNVCFWEKCRVENYVDQKHPDWKKSDIDRYLAGALKEANG
jgi:hypothetical protein